MERAGTAARNSPPSFTLSFFPFSAGPRPGCFWIQRAERRNQRSSVCVDDSLDNQLVSKLPDGRPAVEQNWKFSSSSLFDSVCRRCPSTSSVRPRARSREDSRSILEEYSDRVSRSIVMLRVSHLVAWHHRQLYIIRFLKDSNSFWIFESVQIII